MLGRIFGRILQSRQLTRVSSLIALGSVAFFLPSAWRYIIPALSPHVAICSALSLRFGSMLYLLSIPMLVIMAVRRRFWCRHLCPVGLITETCGRFGRKHKLDDRQQSGKQRESERRIRVPFSTGRCLALASLGGAVIGYPLFLWMDPLSLFSGFMSFTQASAMGLVIVALISIVWPGLWCARICPLGGTQDLLARLADMKTKNADPDQTVRLSKRRFFLAAGLGAAFSAFIPRSLSAKNNQLRPPGSVDGAAFEGACIRCANCARSCPSGIIEPSVEPDDIMGLLTPRLIFTGNNYCREDCNRCGQACPTGAIRPLSLERKNRHVIGTARIDLAECLLTLDEECGVCMPRCPYGAIVEEFSRETYTTTVKVIADKCNGCGACVGICPAKVITVEPARVNQPGRRLPAGAEADRIPA